MTKLRCALAGASLALLLGSAACSGSTPTTDTSPASSAAVIAAAPTQTKASSSLQSPVATTATYADLCKRNCAALHAVQNLPSCSPTGPECNAQVNQAAAVIKVLRQDMIDSGINRADHIDLDDALSGAATAINNYDALTCSDSSICGIQALTVKLSTGTVAIVLGG